jgi:hypothetical protein
VYAEMGIPLGPPLGAEGGTLRPDLQLPLNQLVPVERKNISGPVRGSAIVQRSSFDLVCLDPTYAFSPTELDADQRVPS